MNQQEYDALSPAEQASYDVSQRQKEAQEQAALPYKWSQDLDTVSFTFEIPGASSTPTRAKALDVAIKKTSFKLAKKDTKETLLEGTFPREVKIDDCTWSLGE